MNHQAPGAYGTNFVPVGGSEPTGNVRPWVAYVGLGVVASSIAVLIAMRSQSWEPTTALQAQLPATYQTKAGVHGATAMNAIRAPQRGTVLAASQRPDQYATLAGPAPDHRGSGEVHTVTGYPVTAPNNSNLWSLWLLSAAAFASAVGYLLARGSSRPEPQVAYHMLVTSGEAAGETATETATDAEPPILKPPPKLTRPVYKPPEPESKLDVLVTDGASKAPEAPPAPEAPKPASEVSFSFNAAPAAPAATPP
eukprot:CAMPEP_0174356202 /NCGR_PEP_ID=MMETSP0811_2-20130205/29499_1 /TAXON_ID=73025 ORGANISM="Eutreptiella gymnastica-like, Strain CCMP1594" /NCGR_SAMPLE_ID=MMETSP0811_2 /ASSEMBLY_ACC=CAM_ASM_000667 /LENGTH=252 /DNA_ID=CAMNT_0015488117 /DNA_START=58 /DNA_END=812 /DNA_ORIENTATION=+